MPDVMIAGIAEPVHGRISGLTPMALHERLALQALDDAGLELRDVDTILTLAPRSDSYLIHAAAFAEYLGITPPIALTLEGGGAAPAIMVDMARNMIQGGSAKIVLIVSADMPLSVNTRDSYVNTLADSGPVHPDLERPYGPTVPSLFGMVAHAYMNEFGADDGDLGAVAIHDRAAAILHPNSHMRAPMDFAAYRASHMIADPLRLLDCSPVSDGGAAVVVTSAERAGKAGKRPVRAIGAGFSMTHLHLSAAPSLTAHGAGLALDRALTFAKRARSDIDVALVYDCFSIAMLINAEDLGFAPKGRAGVAFRDGEFKRDGRLPINTHGGLLSHGYPGRAAGIGNLIEAVVQLRGEAGERQIPNAEMTMTHGMGGLFATHGVLLLEAT
jgi:acetyl-CoA acetyltransferase